MQFIRSLLVYLLTLEARLILWKYDPYIVAVTGNMGKTSTKDAIYTAIQGKTFVRKSEKSLNSEFGVPLTIIGKKSGWNNPLAWLGVLLEGILVIGLKNHYPKVLVLEVGADHPGDIAKIAAWLKPHVAVITGIPDVPVHITYFDSVEALAEEKKQLAKHVRKGGAVILNGDDARTRALYSEFRALAVMYGTNEGNMFSASHVEVVYENSAPVGMRFRVNHKGSSVPVFLSGVLGSTHVLPVLAAVAAAHAMKIDVVTAGAALNTHEGAPGRMRILKGKHGTTVIDDSYNASPAAIHAALDTLEDLRTEGRKIGMLGDMRELGSYSKDAHIEVGEHAAQVLDILVTVGEESQVLAAAAKENGMGEGKVKTFGYGESAAAGRYILDILKPGDIVLVKGSQNMIRMEKAVKVLMAEPERAEELLVRQEPEWRVR